jgi:hypothetical protein
MLLFSGVLAFKSIVKTLRLKPESIQHQYNSRRMVSGITWFP